MKTNMFKVMAGMVAISILASAVTLGVSAADEKAVIGSTTGKAGETVKVAVTFENNPGADGVIGKFQWDPALVCKGKADAVNATIVDDYLISDGAFGLITNSTLTETDLTIFNLVFEIPVDATVGTTYEVSFSQLSEYSSGTDDFADVFTLVPGTITVVAGEATETPAASTPAPTVAPPIGTASESNIETGVTDAVAGGAVAMLAATAAAASAAFVLKRKNK